MKKNYLLTTGMLTALLLTGCGANNNNAENEALKKQVAQLEQQIDTLQKSNTDENNIQTDTQTSEKSHTMEELSAMVDAFIEKADSTAPSGETQADMELFFSLKQEENQLDHTLDLHEDELENQYRNGTLTREEYRTLERELEHLEDRLDDAEDRMERTFGIDD